GDLTMRIGVVFPQTEIGSDAAVIKDYAQLAEELGFSHILVYDHVLGANLASRPGWKPPYSYLDSFHEPLVLFAYLAGVTQKIEFATGIVILPQRQTVLVAKQAAALDVLSGGRLRFGIGIGWNPKPSARISKTAAAARKNRSKCCAGSGAMRSSPSKAAGTRSPTPASIPCRCSARSRSGSAAPTSAPCAVWQNSAMVGFH